MKKIFLFFSLLLGLFVCNGQAVTFTAVAKSTATTINPLKYDDFRADTMLVTLNHNDSTITFGKDKYLIFDRQKHWTYIGKKRYQYVIFQCTNAYYEKVMIRYEEYDNGKKRWWVQGEKHAFKVYVKK